MKKTNHLKRTAWKDVAGEHDSFLSAYPEFKRDEKMMSTLRTMSAWGYLSRLKEEQRFVELVWMQPNFIETLINGMLTAYFFVVGGKKRKKENHNLIYGLNLYHKIKLLYALNLIDKALLGKLEQYRTTRNNLIHKLMKQVQIGKDIDRECKRFCERGFELQDILHRLLWDFVRNPIN